MTFDTFEKTNHNTTIVVNNEFYVRAIAAWLLLLVPGFLMALVFGRWLHYLVVAPLVISPLTIWAYDLSQFLRKPGARSKKLLLLSLMGFGLALLFSYMAVQVNIGQSASAPVSSVAPTLIESTEAADSKFQNIQQLQPVDALERAKQLGEQASQMVKEPPYPLLAWESAQQRWEQAVQYLKSIPLSRSV